MSDADIDTCGNTSACEAHQTAICTPPTRQANVYGYLPWHSLKTTYPYGSPRPSLIRDIGRRVKRCVIIRIEPQALSINRLMGKK